MIEKKDDLRAMMSTVRFDVLTFLTKPHAIIDGAIKNGKIGSEMLQQPRLFVRVLNLK